MNKRELEREGKSWVEEGIITEEQLNKILQREQGKDANYLIILFAVLLTGLGFLTFIMSDWARQPHLSRIVIIIAVTLFLYVLGDILYRKRGDILAIGFIVLGYIVFGAGMLLTIDIYNVSIYSAWPFLIWTIVGLVLYFLYDHVFLFAVAIAVSTIGQMYGVSLAAFSWLLFILFLVGFGYFVYRERNKLYSYLFAVSYTIQMLVLSASGFQQYFWFMVLMLALYLVGDRSTKEVYRLPFKYLSLGAVFIFGMYQAFILQEEWFQLELEFELSFFLIWLVMFVVGIAMKLLKKRREEMIDFILFLPIVFLPFSYILSLVVLFLFSLGWILIGYLKNNQHAIMLGTIAFLFSTFTVYVQFAWDALNKSLFFFIGGLLLFLISYVIGKQRRRLADENKGSDIK